MAWILMVSAVSLCTPVHRWAAQNLGSTLADLRSSQQSTRQKALDDLLRLGGTGDDAAFGTRMNALMAKYKTDRARIVEAVCQALDDDNTRHASTRFDAADRSDERVYFLRLFSMTNAFAAFGEVKQARVLLDALPRDTAIRTFFIYNPGRNVAAFELLARDSSVGLRLRSMRLLGEIASLSDAKPRDRAIVKRAALVALNDSVPGVRVAAVIALSRFLDEDVRAAISKVAEADPAQERRDAATTYPVRAAATSWLANHSGPMNVTPSGAPISQLETLTPAGLDSLAAARREVSSKFARAKAIRDSMPAVLRPLTGTERADSVFLERRTAYHYATYHAVGSIGIPQRRLMVSGVDARDSVFADSLRQHLAHLGFPVLASSAVTTPDSALLALVGDLLTPAMREFLKLRLYVDDGGFLANALPVIEYDLRGDSIGVRRSVPTVVGGTRAARMDKIGQLEGFVEEHPSFAGVEEAMSILDAYRRAVAGARPPR